MNSKFQGSPYPLLRPRGASSLRLALRPRRWLLPLVPAYRALAAIHGVFLRRGRDPRFRPRIPLVVIGSLRAGGAGKTSVALALARWAAARGLRAALLAYRLGPGRPGADGLLPVGPGSDWRESSDEAVLLARLAGVPVFATRDRARAWRALHEAGAAGPFDLLISDDGFQDPRLQCAFRILLERPGERPGPADLLPAGPFRETARARGRAHLVLAGPFAGVDGEAPSPPWRAADPARRVPDAAAGGPVMGILPVTLPFRARAVLPPLPPGPVLALCGLGDNPAFLAELAAAGAVPAAALVLPDHVPPAEADLAALARRAPGAPILLTRKDAVKLEAPWAGRFPLLPVDRDVVLPQAALEALEAHLAECRAAGLSVPAGANLVH